MIAAGVSSIVVVLLATSSLEAWVFRSPSITWRLAPVRLLHRCAPIAEVLLALLVLAEPVGLVAAGAFFLIGAGIVVGPERNTVRQHGCGCRGLIRHLSDASSPYVIAYRNGAIALCCFVAFLVPGQSTMHSLVVAVFLSIMALIVVAASVVATLAALRASSRPYLPQNEGATG